MFDAASVAGSAVAAVSGSTFCSALIGVVTTVAMEVLTLRVA